jgi:hypothetical protein
MDDVPKFYRTQIVQGQRRRLKFVEEEFRIVNETDTTRTNLLYSKRVSE